MEKGVHHGTRHLKNEAMQLWERKGGGQTTSCEVFHPCDKKEEVQSSHNGDCIRDAWGCVCVHVCFTELPSGGSLQVDGLA